MAWNEMRWNEMKVNASKRKEKYAASQQAQNNNQYIIQ